MAKNQTTTAKTATKTVVYMDGKPCEFRQSEKWTRPDKEGTFHSITLHKLSKKGDVNENPILELLVHTFEVSDSE